MKTKIIGGKKYVRVYVPSKELRRELKVSNVLDMAQFNSELIKSANKIADLRIQDSSLTTSQKWLMKKTLAPTILVACEQFLQQNS